LQCTKTSRFMASGFSKRCTKFLKCARKKKQIFVERNDNWEVPPFAFCSVQYEVTLCTVTERTEADILCAVKCWMLNVTHNNHIPLHIHSVTPYVTSVLCPAVLYIHLLTGKSSASADPNHHQGKIKHFSLLLRCSSADAYSLTSQYTRGFWKTYCWFFRFKIFKCYPNFQLISLESFGTIFPLCFTNAPFENDYQT
jgi:hypothetical protein